MCPVLAPCSFGRVTVRGRLSRRDCPVMCMMGWALFVRRCGWLAVCASGWFCRFVAHHWLLASSGSFLWLCPCEGFGAALVCLLVLMSYGPILFAWGVSWGRSVLPGLGRGELRRHGLGVPSPLLWSLVDYSSLAASFGARAPLGKARMHIDSAPACVV